jgi:dienelactone hydrolase
MIQHLLTRLDTELVTIVATRVARCDSVPVMTTLMLTAAIAALSQLAPQTAGHSKDVDVTAADGVKLRGTYTSPAKPGPGIVLFHQCNMLRAAWTSTAAALAERGMHTLAIDYRGMGDNNNIPSDYAKRPSDADAVLAALEAMPGVDANRIAAGGASCGVDQAVQLARRSGKIRALILLSGSTSASGITYITQATLPTFFAFSTDEGGPLPKMDADLSAGGNAQTRIRRLSNAGHGVPMFERDPTLLPELADWLAKALR